MNPRREAIVVHAAAIVKARLIDPMGPYDMPPKVAQVTAEIVLIAAEAVIDHVHREMLAIAARSVFPGSATSVMIKSLADQVAPLNDDTDVVWLSVTLRPGQTCPNCGHGHHEHYDGDPGSGQPERVGCIRCPFKVCGPLVVPRRATETSGPRGTVGHDS